MLASSRYKKTGTAGFFMSPHSLKNSDYDCLWLPSHSGGFLVSLQPQKYTFSDLAAWYLTGLKLVVL
jgi:hypothetical protein